MLLKNFLSNDIYIFIFKKIEFIILVFKLLWIFVFIINNDVIWKFCKMICRDLNLLVFDCFYGRDD